MTRLRSIATALPAHAHAQADLAALARTVLPPEQAESMARVFDNARIDGRNLAMPLEWYLEPHGHAERAAVYRDVGLALCDQAARDALRDARVTPDSVRGVVFVSTTGTATPSLDARLCNRLGLPADAVRVPVWGLGCAGGVAGLREAAGLAERVGGPVLLVSLELCSINVDIARVATGGGEAKKAAVAAAVFGDGCAAAVLCPADSRHPDDPDGPGRDAQGPRVEGGRSHLFPDTEDVMGWEVTDRNLEVVLSPRIPGIVEREVPGLVDAMLAARGVDRPDAWIFHPGGARVVDAYRDALGLGDDELRWTTDVLRRHGNMSSPTVLFSLRDYLASEPGPGRGALVAALGPGFASEMAWVTT